MVPAHKSIRVFFEQSFLNKQKSNLVLGPLKFVFMIDDTGINVPREIFFFLPNYVMTKQVVILKNS